MNDIETYLASIDPEQKKELQKIRAHIRSLVPDAKETISYGMPVFKYKTKYLIGFSGFKNHMSIFPGSEAIDILKDKLVDYKTSKGTVQFTVERGIPDDLLKEIIELCKTRIDGNA